MGWNDMTDDSSSALDEFGRGSVISLILLIDLLIVFQDWEFPSFKAADIKIAGTFDTTIQCTCFEKCMNKFKNLKCVRKCSDWIGHFFAFNISGKWMNFGPLMVIIVLDLNMFKNQLFYVPVDYGQYVDSTDRIWTIVDPNYLALAYEDGLLREGAESLIAWEARMGAVNVTASALTDVPSNSKYTDQPVAVMAVLGVWQCLMLLFFFGLIGYANHYKHLEKVHTLEKVEIEKENLQTDKKSSDSTKLPSSSSAATLPGSAAPTIVENISEREDTSSVQDDLTLHSF
jgi:hypothetical protein